MSAIPNYTGQQTYTETAQLTGHVQRQGSNPSGTADKLWTSGEFQLL